MVEKQIKPAHLGARKQAVAVTLEEIQKQDQGDDGKEYSHIYFFPHKNYHHIETQKFNEIIFFNSDFQKTVRAESDPFNKEFLQIIRRYQTSFNVLNKPKSENAVAVKEEILNAPFVAFKIEIVPLCTREEFKNSISESIVPVGLPHDCLELQISFLKAKYLSNEKGPQFLVKNKEINIHLRLLLEDLISKLFVALYQKPKQLQTEVSNGKHKENSTPIDMNRLFPFLKQLENVLHQLVRKAISRQLEEVNYYESRMGESEVGQELGEWMKPEDLRLEHAVRLYKQGVAKYGAAAMAEKDQWVYISEIVESKNPEQCKNMCLKIAQQEKQKLQPVQGGAGEEQKQEGDGQEERKAQDGPNIHTETPEIKEALGIVESLTKQQVTVVGLKIYQNIGTLFLQQAQVSCQCMGCNSTFSITCKLLSLKHRLIRLFAPCPKCQRDIKVVFQYSIMHAQNIQNSAVIAYKNIKITEVKGVNYAFTCGNCDNTYIQKQSALTQVIEHNCERCYEKMRLEFFNHQMTPIEPKEPQGTLKLGKKQSSQKK
ncbi:hypothetical protein FGO68_gene2992 [Halteria grandinella]|uniref:CHY-type domain-containing protein n=1 Tax=Halteria grandinella TaxID=5974 RepID=A0A8J8NRN6_HALGN|nr:hypothetical protein FGO68_gene2992 [Halteria grandinella]